MTNNRDSWMHPGFVREDVNRRNQVNSEKWSELQRKKAIELKSAIYAMYGCRPHVYLNYRKNFIAIKVYEPKPSEKNLDVVIQFNSTLKHSGNKLKETDGGIVYQFYNI